MLGVSKPEFETHSLKFFPNIFKCQTLVHQLIQTQGFNKPSNLVPQPTSDQKDLWVCLIKTSLDACKGSH